MKDIPGFYYDAEKNRYFPLSSRTGHETRKNVQDISLELKVGLRASSNVHSKVLQILHRREIGTSPRFGTSCAAYAFKRQYLETQVVEPWIWSYGECSGSAEGALEEFYADIQTSEGLKGANVLAWSNNNGFLTICEILPDMAGSTSLAPEPIFPLSCQSSSLDTSTIPHLLPSECSRISRSKITSMRRLRRTENTNNGNMLYTTLGSAWEGGGVYLLKQGQYYDVNWHNGQLLRLDILRCAVMDCSVWSTAYCSPTSATLGTSNGVVLVHLETSEKAWLIHSKSDVLSQECDSKGNLIFCGFRNGYISMLDLRTPSNRPKRMPSMDMRLENSLPSGRGKRKASRKGTARSKEAVIAQSFEESMRMNSAVCSLMLLNSDENYLLSSSMNGDINLWDRRLCQKGPVLMYEGNYNTHSMLSLGMDASESLLMSGGENSTLRIWSIQSGRLLQTISGLPGVVSGFGSPSESGMRGKFYSKDPWQMWLGSSAGPMYMHGASSGSA